MSKNYADIYNSVNVAIALEQRFYLKQETTRGELIIPTDADFFFTLAGGAVAMTQPFFSSPHRSGRHHTSPVYQKKETSWSIPTYFNIDTTLGAAGVAEIDPALRVLWKSLMGKEDTTLGLKYTPTVPSTSFSIFECGDRVAKQSRLGFVQQATINLPGDGEANCEWSGNAKDVIYVGIGKSVVSNNGGNIVTLDTGDGSQFLKAVGGKVMIIEANGTTRSADTPSGSARTITAVAGDVITLDGAALADADGSALNTPIYLVYYEPAAPAAINNPVTGLVGSMSVTSVGSLCARAMTLTLGNEHELVNYCYGTDHLEDFVPGSRFTAALSIETNLDKKVFKLFNQMQNFQAQVIEIKLGDAAGRHLDIDIPRAIFEVPEIPIPETGSIPISFSGTAYQTVLDAEDEISVHFK
jgi:hypothetical protein